MKRNIIPYVIGSLFIVLLAGCSIKETIYDQETTDSFLQKQADVDPLVNGVYALFYDFDSYRTNLEYLYNSWGPEIYANGGGVWAQSNTKSYDATNRYLSYAPWKGYFQIIRNANSLLARIEPVEMDEAYKSRIKGEMYFMRAFGYFNLVRLYGKLPVFTEDLTSATDFYRTRSSVDDVYSLIFSDLKEASWRCLSVDKQPAGETGRATKGAAQGLTSLAYLTYGSYLDANNRGGDAKSAYQMAVNYADTVLLSNKYALAPRFNDLFDITKEQTAYNTGGEVLFGIRFADISGVNVGCRYPRMFLPNTLYGVTGTQPNRQGDGTLRIQSWFIDKYSSGDYTNDYRSEFTFLTKWLEKGTTKMRVTYPNIPASTESVESGNFAYLNKYRDGGAYDNANHGTDLYFLRLAEIYLVKAEAENEINGPTAKALDAFNMLRARARNANGTARTTPANLTLADAPTKEDFRMKIYDERALELCGEAHALFDNIRMRYKDNKRSMMEYINDDFSKTLTMGFPTWNSSKKVWEGGRAYAATFNWNPRLLLLPVPVTEMDSNPALQGDQNPGW